MAAKKKKSTKAKTNKTAKGAVAGQGTTKINPGDFGDDLALAEAIAASETTATNADIASVDESVLSEVIEASLKSSRQEQEESKTDDKDNGPKQDLLLPINDFMSGQELQGFADGSNSTVVCPHIKKTVNILSLRRTLAKLDDWDHCHGCRVANVRLKKMMDLNPMFAHLSLDNLNNSNEPLSLETLWMCLSCGDINCGRAHKEHAVSHHTDHKTEHPLAVNLASMDCWCYECDDQIVPAKGRNPLVQECQAVISKILQSRLTKARARNNKSALIDAAPKANVFAPGLQNLGNTCFFNSVMQVLAETKSLKRVLSDPARSGFPVSLSATTESGLGPLTTTFKDLLFKMWKQSGGSITPRDLFTQIAKKWKVFRGMRQQDSQELMRYLFDGIKEEELSLIKSRKDTVVAAETTNSEHPEYTPFIESCFGGRLVSVIICDACKK
ncbi:Ubiquitin carboxyl-terminal hydrolase 16, partial [Podila epigama]